MRYDGTVSPILSKDLYDDGTALVKGRYFEVSELDFF